MLSSFKYIMGTLLAKRIIWILLFLETTQMLCIIRRIHDLNYQDILSELAYSLLYTGLALSTCYYGYGILYIYSGGPCNEFLCRLCGASLQAWLRLSFVMLLPWSLKVFQELGQHAFSLFECLANGELSNIILLFSLTLFLLQVILFIISCFIAIRHHNNLANALQLTENIQNHELLSYAQAVNHALGFEMFQIPPT